MVPLRISLQVDTTSNHMSKALKPIPNIYTYIYVQLEFLHCGMYIYIYVSFQVLVGMHFRIHMKCGN
jgi:hypothetical protein